MIYRWPGFALCLITLLLTSCQRESGETARTQDSPVHSDPAIEMDSSIAEWLHTVTGADDEYCSVRYPNPALFQKLDEERPPELEALSFMQTMACYSPDEQIALYDRFALSNDLPGSIELSPPVAAITKRRHQETEAYFGEGHELECFWALHHNRSLYECGLQTFAETTERVRETLATIADSSEEFRQYAQLRLDQWRLDSEEGILECVLSGSIQRFVSQDGLWSQRASAALPDCLRFLDRHGNVRLARMTTTHLRRHAADKPELVFVAWRTLALLSIQDGDWSHAFTCIDLARQNANKLGEDKEIVTRGLKNDFARIAGVNGFSGSGSLQKSSPIELQIAKQAEHSQAKVVSELLGYPRYELPSNFHELQHFAFNVRVTSLLSKDPAFLRQYIELLDSRHASDWTANRARVDLIKFYSRDLPADKKQQIHRLVAAAIPQLSHRLSSLAGSTSHDHLLQANLQLARSVAFAVSYADTGSQRSISESYFAFLAMREADSREMRDAVRSAKATSHGKVMLSKIWLLTSQLQAELWQTHQMNPRDHLLRNARLIVTKKLLEEQLIQSFSRRNNTEQDNNWYDDLEYGIAVIDFFPWIDFEQSPPAQKLGAFVSQKTKPSSPTETVFVRLENEISRPQIDRLAKSASRGLELITSGQSHTANSLGDLTRSILNTLDIETREVVLGLESSTANLPWTSEIRLKLADANLPNLEKVTVCFHPSQILEARERKQSTEQGTIHFVGGSDYGEIREQFPLLPFDIPDLPEIEKESKAIAEIAENTSWDFNAAPASIPATDFGPNDILHIAGHATHLDLRAILALRDPEPFYAGVQQEMNVWSRMPYVASTLLLASNDDADEQHAPFVTAASLQFLPYDPPKTVVLSTCNSVGGHGLPAKNPAGLAKALWIWGVDEIIASSDPIPDNVPSNLLPKFYKRHLNGEPASEAFSKVYSDQLEANRGKRYTYNWNFYGL